MEPRNDEPLLLPFEDATPSRRGFLHMVGFGIAGAALSGCSRGPVRYVVPALLPDDQIVPGRAYWIASTCGGCEAGCGVLAKCMDGRPIKLEGLPGHPVSSGGLCAPGQASVLSLYDSRRLDGPLHMGEPVSFERSDRELGAAFERLRRDEARVRLLTGTIHAPSTRAAIARFLGEFGDGRHVVYDGLSASALLEAHELVLGQRILPRFRFERARTIVSFDADFLATWISPVEHTAGYARGRKPDGSGARMSRHFQLEARTSLTGCRADERARLAPWETLAALEALCGELEALAGVAPRFEEAAARSPRSELIHRMAKDLWGTRGEALVVAGANELGVQLLAAYANHLLESYGATIDVEQPSLQRMGDDRALEGLRAELEAGEVDALIVQGANPAYDLGGRIALERAGLLVSCAASLDETAALAHWVCPEPHALERWDDGEPHEGSFVLTQPTVPPLRAARTLRASLARWSGDSRSDRELLREHWRAELFPRWSAGGDFDAFFDRALHEGHVHLPGAPRTPATFRDEALEQLAQPAQPAPAEPPAGSLALVLYAKTAMLDGRHAHNPWLHELPDPVSKVTWDNYAALSPTAAKALGLVDGDVVLLDCDAAEGTAASIELPVHVQPGQHDGVVAVALGYGRAGTDRFVQAGPGWIQARPTVEPGGTVGSSAASLVELSPEGRRFEGRAVRLRPAGRRVDLAVTQDHHSLAVPAHLAIPGSEVREAVLTTSFAAYTADPGAVTRGQHPPGKDLWPDDHPRERSWGMAIDLARCTGCSACVIACQAENNVPVVGKDEVRRHREMSWLRIDRYYQGEGDELRTLHQPMLCQHCDHAPCESVCPVLATVQSAEGLNQQVYNRCVGTRYCGNTCPYKVRRFNWFEYQREDHMANHALNPDVTVRSRGVMEKCSFCVQRIQEAKAQARVDGRPLLDGDVTVACQQSCPAEAIVFGDLLDPESRVARLAAETRAYGVLEEMNVRPSVRYLAHVHNAGGPEEQSRG